MSTEAETESIVEALTASWNEVEAEVETAETDAPQDVSEPVEVVATDDGEDTPIEENEVPVETQEPIPDQEPETVFLPPEHWSSEVKEQFTALPPEAQEILLARDKEFQTGYQEQAQSITDIQQAIEPWKQTIAQLGVSEGQAIRSLFATYNQLLNDPLNGIQNLAKNFGVLDQLIAPDTNDDYTDPAVKALREQISDLQGQLTQIGQTQEQSFQSEGQRVIEDFKSEKDAQGNEAHPFFEEALPLITPLVQQGKSLEEAYEQVKWAVPAYRDAQAPKEVVPTAEEKAAKVKQARRAANTVKSTGTDAPDQAEAELSLHDELQAAWKQLS